MRRRFVLGVCGAGPRPLSLSRPADSRAAAPPARDAAGSLECARPDEGLPSALRSPRREPALPDHSTLPLGPVGASRRRPPLPLGRHGRAHTRRPRAGLGLPPPAALRGEGFLQPVHALLLLAHEGPLARSRRHRLPQRQRPHLPAEASASGAPSGALRKETSFVSRAGSSTSTGSTTRDSTGAPARRERTRARAPARRSTSSGSRSGRGRTSRENPHPRRLRTATAASA